MMVDFFKDRAIWVHNGHLDFRKQMNGLIEIVVEEMGKSPNDGSLYVFRNKQRNKLKVLIWDRNGFVLGYKRLERGHFDFPKMVLGSMTITPDELYMMVSGMPIVYVGKDAEKELYFS